MMTVLELYEQVRDGKIISDISLQREIVYNLEKQQLVNSTPRFLSLEK